MSSNLSGRQMRHAKLVLPEPQVSASHPYKNKKIHQELLEYIKDRLDVGKKARDEDIPRLTRLDKKMAGWMKLSAEDRKREAKSQETGEPLMTHINLPLTFVHVDDMMTFLASVFAPNRGMFYNSGSPDEVEEAGQLVTKMNNDAIYSGYYREVLYGLFNVLKYNLTGYTVAWGSESGPVVSAGEGDTTTFESKVRWQGNRLKALDRYNWLIDPACSPAKLYMEGEFGAYAELRSHFWVLSRAANGQFFNVKEGLAAGAQDQRCEYYRHPPAEAQLAADDSRGTDWISVLAQRPATVQDGHELVTCYIKLNPTEFGLIPANQRASRNHLEIWRFTIMDGKYIIQAEWMNNVHNHIPMYFGIVHDDSMGASQKSPAELLVPLQDFASFLLNTHMEASRDNIYGTTMYDPTMVKLDKIPKGETAARIPVEPKAYGKDIRSFVWDKTASTDTRNTLSDLEGVMGIINQFFPTQSLPSQIASIDRAVTNQVAAVTQGANRRQQKGARLLDETTFRPIRSAMYYNILQYQPDGEELADFYTGKQVTLDLASLRDTNLPFIIGQGLKALDRQASTEMIQSILFALIQAPQAAQGIDLLAMMDYWTSMMDVDFDMKQFRLNQPEAQPGAPQVDEAGNPIQPATAPSAVTAPIYGGQ